MSEKRSMMLGRRCRLKPRSCSTLRLYSIESNRGVRMVVTGRGGSALRRMSLLGAGWDVLLVSWGRALRRILYLGGGGGGGGGTWIS